ncbi:ECF transporter S component [Nocardioides daphniae]|uniref:ECF transporter S component n=1 Tax=Nocardioides daphniae TaxID=402297 RepID=A0A4P7UA44_9ACTN|nr:ECF transporter S component [Nocardioides daphniae]QCC76504.1 ECF transporter S component [Nocardioides daphniae]
MSDVRTSDEVVLRLQALRRSAGEPSYAEIARLVARVRTARGVAPRSRCRPAPPSTTRSAWGRRLDRDLVADMTEALELEAARLGARAVAVSEQVPDESEQLPEPASAEHQGPTRRQRSALLVVCLLVNLAGMAFIDALRIPVWLDMIGTAVAAIALGPWWGVLVGVSSSGLDGLLTGAAGFWFTPVTALGALIWGYGARTFGMARTTGRFLLLNLAVASASTALAAPITWLVFSGYTPHDSSALTASLVEHLPWLLLAAFVSNLVFSVLDKMMTGFISLAVVDALTQRWPWLAAALRR